MVLYEKDVKKAMAVRSKEELTANIRQILGENPDDAGMAILEDVADTFDSLDGEDWKTKYTENDKAWRKKYADRFNSGGSADEDDDDDPPPKRLKYEDLFKEN